MDDDIKYLLALIVLAVAVLGGGLYYASFLEDKCAEKGGILINDYGTCIDKSVVLDESNIIDTE